MRCDLFCRVVDNYGDAAICWRIARQLAGEHGLRVRLWIDAPAVLAVLVPGARAGLRLDGVEIETWSERDPRLADPAPDAIADVVVGAFACTLPDAYRVAMRARRPVWIDLEYLSAEDWVPGHHGLPSPKPDGLVEHFFFPGPHPASGGLVREADLFARRDAFDDTARTEFLAGLGVAPRAGERLASLFCYPDAAVPALLDAFAARPETWRVLVPAGVTPLAAGHPVAVPVPWIAQADYDRLLWSCDLNFVRGEDSVVRGLWAARPMVWQAYRQDEGAHRPKVRAWIDGWIAQAAPGEAAAAALRALEDAWNADAADAAAALPAALPALLDRLPELAAAARRWTAVEAGRPDLASRLVDFIVVRL
ncbi:MAG: elongation factor P maturation arginine rhamnosyltransferase EarP [Burkholderiales bacterium]